MSNPLKHHSHIITEGRDRAAARSMFKAIGFTDDKSDARVADKLETHEGRDVTILDNRGICSHAGHCTSGRPAVWRSAIYAVRFSLIAMRGSLSWRPG